MQIDSTIPTAFHSSWQGLQRSTHIVNGAATSLAREGAHNVGALVSLLEGELTYKANAKTLGVSSRLLGVLLEIEA